MDGAPKNKSLPHPRLALGVVDLMTVVGRGREIGAGDTHDPHHITTVRFFIEPRSGDDKI